MYVQFLDHTSNVQALILALHSGTNLGIAQGSMG